MSTFNQISTVLNVRLLYSPVGGQMSLLAAGHTRNVERKEDLREGEKWSTKWITKWIN